MATNIIDVSVHGSSFPTGYTGAGTIAASSKVSGGIINQAHGFFTSNNNATQINIGFRPLKIKVFNLTDVIVWEWQYGFGATQSAKTVTAGTLTIDTTSQIVISTDLAGNHTVTLGATLNGTGKVLSYAIEG